MDKDYLGNLLSLDGKVALVTGASSGLGRHFAAVLARAGAEVVVTARRTDKLRDLVGEIEAAGGRAHAVAMDVTDAPSVTAAFDRAAAVAGVPDIVINNAGQTITKPLLQQTEADWDNVIDPNLKGCWLVGTEAARRMVDAGKAGSIVNIASILAERVGGGVAPYTISKAGVLQATRAMALELARHGIRVNALMPGYVITDLNRDFLTSEAGDKLRMRIPSRRFCELADLDGPLLLLASGAGGAMSGASVAVDRAHLVSGL
ncbi:NAD(P)-dependent dehydrogenase, short-chain alcohol dehydrogenase family [Aromatoleum tolulyticum]|uniref:NAD(P)-dependent dehydrogenase, short-chain alcohol dehydrogenase family n=1 Tax=Aromatoleum tolulyticum TaxID=34027 RepID=A0A1N6SRD9_9RHOO|nr:SDR family NAD(P)-dependent oxidoreductase [Aromatoleum tolulyticum]SIQ43587.1 NAD(P)-dependent dehydrogenase, short-chain alcohol dehydrogenase family [Aromatoleum tolulyticum]